MKSLGHLLSVCLLAGSFAPVFSQAEAVKLQTLQVASEPAPWWHDAIFYEIWPRSFKDTDGDGHGDFNGMTAKLPYLDDLGVDAIWLTPIFEAPSYHGYDFVDFYAVEEDYGTMADFERFMAEAHAHGMKVILDLVINHISSEHPWFQKSAAGEAPYSDYFLWREEPPAGWGRAWETTPNPEAVWHWSAEREAYYYGAFGPTQPDINLELPDVRREIEKMAKFWLDKGVDGFRLDAVRYALEDLDPVDQADTAGTIAYWREFTAYVESIKPDAMLVAEAWADMPTVGSYYDAGEGMHSAFDFDFGYVVTGLLNDVERTADFGNAGEASGVTGREALWQNLQDRLANAPMSFYAPFLTNHDQVRVMHVLDNDFAKMRIAAGLLFTSPGTLYLYYGEEIGMPQARTGDDTYKRDLMLWENTPTAGFSSSSAYWVNDPQWVPWKENFAPWWQAYWDALRSPGGRSVAEQQADPSSLWHLYRKLAHARKALPALSQPDTLQYYPVAETNAWVVEAEKDGSRVLVLINLDPQRAIQVILPESLQGEAIDMLHGTKLKVGERFALAPAQTRILQQL